MGDQNRVNLKDYIRGQRHGKEANQLERKAMDDPFLQDSIDGYDSVKGDHISQIEDLEKRIPSPQKRTGRRMWVWAAAAVTVLLTGIPLLLQLPGTEEERTFASYDTVQQKKKSAASSPQEDTMFLAEHRELKNVELSSSTVPPDKIYVKGRIVDENGEPVPGTTITHPNRQDGTISDNFGNFQLLIPKDEQGILIASYIGMENSKIPMKEDVGDITMKAENAALSEVVVTGYGKAKRISKTGSFAALTDTLKTGSMSDAEEKTAFAEEDFRKYFAENYDKACCAGEKITIAVEFRIDATGRPGNITIKENPCPALENEIKRLLLGSPLWSERNRRVTLQMELP